MAALFHRREGAANGKLIAGLGIAALCLASACAGAAVMGLAVVLLRPQGPPTTLSVDAPPVASPIDTGAPADPPLDVALSGFRAQVMAPNIAASGLTELSAPDAWDKALLAQVARYEAVFARAWKFWTALDSARDNYAFVLAELRKAGLPDVLAAIPYQESRYLTGATSVTCARGAWQLMPEVAHRLGLALTDCKLRGAETLWAPSDRVVPPLAQRVYANPDPLSCRIESCAVDERQDLQRATAGAISLLSEVYNDAELRASGAVTQLTIASYNAGYDDSRFDGGEVHPDNILPAYRAWLVAHRVQRAPTFIGDNLTCKGGAAPGDRCGGSLYSETQQYVPVVIAQHLLAACYYGKNYGERPEFAEYTSAVAEWCAHVEIPTKAQIAARPPQ